MHKHNRRTWVRTPLGTSNNTRAVSSHPPGNVYKDFSRLMYVESSLRQVPLPAHSLVCTLSAPLSVRFSQCGRQGRVWRWQYGLCEQRRFQGRRGRTQDRVGKERIDIGRDAGLHLPVKRMKY